MAVKCAGQSDRRLESKYKAVSIDGKYNGDVSDEQYNNIMLLNFPLLKRLGCKHKKRIL